MSSPAGDGRLHGAHHAQVVRSSAKKAAAADAAKGLAHYEQTVSERGPGRRTPGPKRKPGASLYTRKRLSLYLHEGERGHALEEDAASVCGTWIHRQG